MGVSGGGGQRPSKVFKKPFKADRTLENPQKYFFEIQGVIPLLPPITPKSQSHFKAFFVVGDLAIQFICNIRSSLLTTLYPLPRLMHLIHLIHYLGYKKTSILRWLPKKVVICSFSPSSYYKSSLKQFSFQTFKCKSHTVNI